MAIAASPLATARRMRHVIADFDAGPKSGCRKYEGSNIRTPHPYNGAIWSLWAEVVEANPLKNIERPVRTRTPDLYCVKNYRREISNCATLEKPSIRFSLILGIARIISSCVSDPQEVKSEFLGLT